MPYELFLAFRYLRKRGQPRLARVTVLAALGGVALGVAALIVALAIANGFSDEMRDRILRGTSHITLSRVDGQPIVDCQKMIAGVAAVPGVAGAFATSYDGALLSGPKGAAYTVLRGVDPSSPRALDEIRQTLIEGSLEALSGNPNQTAGTTEHQAPAAIIGAELAERAGLRVDSIAEIDWAGPASDPSNSASRAIRVATEKTVDQVTGQEFTTVSRQVRIAGIFRSGLYEYDSTWLYLPLATATSLSGQAHPAPAISIEVKNIYEAPRVAAALRSRLGDEFSTIDWQQANQPLFAALGLERRVVALIIALVILIATLNIATALVLLVADRRREIAILGAMGARRRSITGIFLIEGALIGAAGTLAGSVLGLIACALGNHYQIVSLPSAVYSITAVPFHARATDVGISMLAAFGLSVLATIYPAFAAARLRPAESLRES
jgi:lipoprotein-releasing system permease protein